MFEQIFHHHKQANTKMVDKDSFLINKILQVAKSLSWTQFPLSHRCSLVNSNFFIILNSQWINFMWECLTTAKLYSFTATLNHSTCQPRCWKVKKIAWKAIFQRENLLFFTEWILKLEWKFVENFNKNSPKQNHSTVFCFQIHCTPEIESFFRNYFSIHLKFIRHSNDWHNKISMIPTPLWVFMIFHVSTNLPSS